MTANSPSQPATRNPQRASPLSLPLLALLLRLCVRQRTLSGFPPRFRCATLVPLLAALLPFAALAQSSRPAGGDFSFLLHVDEARHEGGTLDPALLGMVLRGYRLEEGHPAFSNHWTNALSMSHGRVWQPEVEELSPQEAADFFRYRVSWFWTYRNSYDLVEGLATVFLYLDHGSRGSDFLMDIRPEGQGNLVLRGTVIDFGIELD